MSEHFFDNMTIGQLRKMTEDYKKLQKENEILKAKYPNKLKNKETAEDIIESVKGGKY